MYCWEILAEFKHTGTLSAGDTWEPTPVRLDKHVAEIVAMEIKAPFSAEGNEEDLLAIWPVIDGQSLEEYIFVPGRYSWNLFPYQKNVIGGTVLVFGVPKNTDPLLNTTLKAADKIGVRARAGASDVTGDFIIRFYGIRYKTEEDLKRVYGDTVYGATQTYAEGETGKEISFTKPALDVTMKNWSKFSGGIYQDNPKIMPFVRFARNANATTVNSPYAFDYEGGNVALAQENMSFDMEEDEALIVERIGVRTVSNLKYFWLYVANEDRPYSKWTVSEEFNPLHFGHAYPYVPNDMPLFYPLYELPAGHKIVIHDSEGEVRVQDNGTSIAANNIIVAIAGKTIEKM